jgi:hypothetical protein
MENGLKSRFGAFRELLRRELRKWYEMVFAQVGMYSRAGVQSKMKQGPGRSWGRPYAFNLLRTFQWFEIVELQIYVVSWGQLEKSTFVWLDVEEFRDRRLILWVWIDGKTGNIGGIHHMVGLFEGFWLFLMFFLVELTHAVDLETSFFPILRLIPAVSKVSAYLLVTANAYRSNTNAQHEGWHRLPTKAEWFNLQKN